MSIMFNEICIYVYIYSASVCYDRNLYIYISVYIYIYIYIHIYIYIYIERERELWYNETVCLGDNKYGPLSRVEHGCHPRNIKLFERSEHFGIR